jgi:hypothetical protein
VVRGKGRGHIQEIQEKNGAGEGVRIYNTFDAVSDIRNEKGALGSFL